MQDGASLILFSCFYVSIRRMLAFVLVFLPLLWLSSPTVCAERYLDRMAIRDARWDLAQEPQPGYALDANSVFRMPLAPGPARTIIIGDSILTGWSGYFAHLFPHAIISGRVGRQFSAAIPIWESLQRAGLTRNAQTVILELGTNGAVTPMQMARMLALIGNRTTFLVMPEMPRPWEPEVQHLYEVVASLDPQVHLVYWNLLSEHHPSYFWSDMVHPNWKGIQVMAQAIRRAVQAVSFQSASGGGLSYSKE